MNAAPLHLGAERVMLDPAGVLHWPAQKLLCVADLHLEKASAFARAGYFLPPYDTRETLARLALLIRRYGPKRLVFLGDSFHDADGAARLSPADRAALLRLLEGLEPIWVLGNHDPAPPCDLPGEAFAEWRQGPITFRHIPSPFSRQAPPEIAGHPAIARLFPQGGRAFLLGEERLYSFPLAPGRGHGAPPQQGP